MVIHNSVPSGSGDPDTSRYGDPLDVPDVGVSSPARVQPAAVLGGPAEEVLTSRDTRLTRFRVFLPADAPVTALSTIDWDGFSHTVDGEPSHFDGSVSPHHLEVQMTRIEG